MNILLFHPVHLPALQYGGTERVVMWLAKGLHHLGHRVWIAALEGSQLPEFAQLVPIPRGQISLEQAMKFFPREIEVLHLMAPPSESEIQALKIPYVLTIHGNGKSGEKFPLNTVFLSSNHAQRHHSTQFVYNGLDPSEYRFNPAPRAGAYLFFSKTSWRVKNLAAAMKRCRRAHVPLWIAGGNRPWLQRLRSALTPGFQWFGSVGGEEKSRLLAESRALLFPIAWDEPFGLAVVEALLSGTPVIAHRKGSLPELVPADVGVLLEDRDEVWVEYLKKETLPWDARRCRQWAEEKFHHHRMAQEYVKMYGKVVQGQSLNTSFPYAE